MCIQKLHKMAQQESVMDKKSNSELEMEWFEDLIAIYRYASITKAAENRNISQPTMSRRIKQFENWLGPNITLLERSSYPASLTETGEKILEKAFDITGKIRDVRNTIRAEYAHNNIKLHIASLHSLTTTHVPRFVEKVFDAGGYDLIGIGLDVSPGTIIECVDSVLYGHKDFMFSYENKDKRVKFPESTPDVKVEAITIAEDSLIPVCSQKNFEKYQDSWNKNRPIPYISYPSGTYLRNIIDERLDYVAPTKMLFSTVLELPQAETIRNCATRNLGVGWIIKSSACNALDRGEIVKFEASLNGKLLDLSIPLKIQLYRNKRKQFSEIAEKFWHTALKNQIE